MLQAAPVAGGSRSLARSLAHSAADSYDHGQGPRAPGQLSARHLHTCGARQCTGAVHPVHGRGPLRCEQIECVNVRVAETATVVKALGIANPFAANEEELAAVCACARRTERTQTRCVQLDAALDQRRIAVQAEMKLRVSRLKILPPDVIKCACPCHIVPHHPTTCLNALPDSQLRGRLRAYHALQLPRADGAGRHACAQPSRALRKGKQRCQPRPAVTRTSFRAAAGARALVRRCAHRRRRVGGQVRCRLVLHLHGTGDGRPRPERMVRAAAPMCLCLPACSAAA